MWIAGTRATDNACVGVGCKAEVCSIGRQLLVVRGPSSVVECRLNFFLPLVGLTGFDWV